MTNISTMILRLLDVNPLYATIAMSAFVAAFILTFITTYALYAAVIMFRSLRDEGKLNGLAPSVIWCIKLILWFGLLIDAILNIVFLTVYFWELPREILSTFRVKRWYRSEKDSRNKRKAIWFANNWLLPIDQNHMDG